MARGPSHMARFALLAAVEAESPGATPKSSSVELPFDLQGPRNLRVSVLTCLCWIVSGRAPVCPQFARCVLVRAIRLRFPRPARQMRNSNGVGTRVLGSPSRPRTKLSYVQFKSKANDAQASSAEGADRRHKFPLTPCQELTALVLTVLCDVLADGGDVAGARTRSSPHFRQAVIRAKRAVYS